VVVLEHDMNCEGISSFTYDSSSTGSLPLNSILRYFLQKTTTGITTVMGATVASGRQVPMMVMEYMENGSLYDLLQNETLHAGGDMIVQVFRDVAQGLRFLHASKPPILHGDLKAKVCCVVGECVCLFLLFLLLS
jgi:serine/threonine protein kinase